MGEVESDSLLVDGLQHHGGSLPQIKQGHDSSYSQAQVLAQVLVLAQAASLGSFLHITCKEFKLRRSLDDVTEVQKRSGNETST